MPIVVNPNPPPRFQVVGRVGFHRGAAQFVDTTTGYLQKPLTQSALGPVERAYNPAIPHQDLRGPGRVLIQAGQDTMRAHHIADSQIQQIVCDYMNGQITLLTLLDRLGVLYLTSWIDVVVTPRLFYIWRQWAHSLVSTFGIALASFRGLAPNQQARLATNLAAALSSSISNLRVGDQQTDAALGQAIAPRLQRGQWDLVGSFVGWLSRYNFAQPTLSVETSLAVAVWGNHFVQHPLALAAPLQPVNNVFAGRLVNGPILISEQRPAGGARQATIAMPNLYPGTQGSTGYVIRATRATIHLGVIVAILYMMYAAASRGPPFTALSRQGGYAHILKGYFYETPLSGRERGSMVMLAVKPAGRFLRLKLNSCFRVEQQSPARELFQELPSTGRITSHFSRSRRKANQHSTAPERDIAQQGRR